ncbi:uncharacterized protein METZ01_LOCUS13764 [marine metagenome]|uniref:Uncharacterized protein n=1 Tax=marine metagenome TaxID=408172 RepID=A0A381P226_9ZZZZ
MIKKILIFCVFAFIFYLRPALVESADIDEINIMLKKEKDKLSKLENEIENQTKILNKMGRKEYSNLKKKRILDGQLKIKERELKIYNWNLKINKNNVSALTKKIAHGEKQIYLQQKNLGRRLRTIYKEGDLFSVKLLFSSEDFTDLLRRAKYLDSIMAYDRFIFNNYERELADFYNKKEVLLHAKGQLDLYKNAAITKKKEIVKEKEKKKQFLAKLTKEKSINIRLREELVNSSKNLNQLISRLENKIIHGEGLDISDKKGNLLSPVKGKLLNNFGRERDKKYNTYIVHNGVSIRVRKGAPVRSVFNGKVLYTGTLDGYGNIIIIGHGMNYHSLYGHLDEIISSAGKTVRSGQIIGRSGDSGSVKGEALYFEMRYKGKPIEPTAWLSQSSN